jgi:hypothetical protein
MAVENAIATLEHHPNIPLPLWENAEKCNKQLGTEE